ncbi:MAG: hypothetical protein CMJ89_15015 [Planctomycetes bacterium]|nr:hypothetical protein [Planctomycetota bacterium]
MTQVPDISVVIPTWNTRDLLERCLDSLYASEGPSFEVIVVDNASSDGSAALIEERYPAVQLIENDRNEGFAIACNQGMKVSIGRYVLLLNTDTETPRGGLAEMIAFLEKNETYGALAPRLVFPDGRTQCGVHDFPTLSTAFFFATPFERWFPESRELRRYFKRDWDHETSEDIDQPPAAVLLIRRAVLKQVGLFDERLWLFYNDVDLSLRIKRAGWKTRYLADVCFIHHHGSSTAKFDDFLSQWQKDRLLYYRKHYGVAGSQWVKACVGLALLDFLQLQLRNRMRGRPAEPVWPLARRYAGFLRM